MNKTKNKEEFIKHLTEENYQAPFKERDNSEPQLIKQRAALERAWKNRDFEIDKYWSRATYFWAFIAATFAGFIAVCNANNIGANFKVDLRLTITSMGMVFSMAWVFVNLGSKKWQKNWEKHIDMLEDEITGPIYKTVLREQGFSVSKINILVSKFVWGVWTLILFGQVLYILCPECISSLPKMIIPIIILVTTVIFAICMYCLCRTNLEHGDKESYSFNRRPKQYEGPKIIVPELPAETNTDINKPGTPD